MKPIEEKAGSETLAFLAGPPGTDLGKTARDLVRRSPTVVSEGMPAQDADELAAQLGIHHLVVVDERRQPVGIVCSCDLWGRGPLVDVGEVMSAPLDTVESETPAREVAKRILQLQRGCLPVMDHGKLVGVVTRGDLRRAGMIPSGACVRCVLCGTFHHVRTDPSTGQPVCLECSDTEPWIDLDDLEPEPSPTRRAHRQLED